MSWHSVTSENDILLGCMRVLQMPHVRCRVVSGYFLMGLGALSGLGV